MEGEADKRRERMIGLGMEKEKEVEKGRAGNGRRMMKEEERQGVKKAE